LVAGGAPESGRKTLGWVSAVAVIYGGGSDGGVTPAPLNATRAIFAGGIEAQREGQTWKLVTNGRTFDSFLSLQTAVGKPFLVEMIPEPPIHLLLHPRTGEALEIAIGKWLSSGQLNARNLFHVRNLTYHVHAATYHCRRLAFAYAELCSTIARFPNRDIDRVIFGGGDHAYFEFDACVTAARRTYDALKYPLWSFFNSKRTDCPELSRVLQRADKLPSDLRAAVETSWASHGIRAKDYRDSIAHFTPVEFGMGSADMQKHSCGAWFATLRIPDNPEKRKRQAFTFNRGLDALQYCLDLVAEVAAVASIVARAIAPPQRAEHA
jgi:hypothetical protein